MLVNLVRKKGAGKLNPFFIYPPSIIYFILVQIYAHNPVLVDFFGGLENKGTVIGTATVLYVITVIVLYKLKNKRNRGKCQ